MKNILFISDSFLGGGLETRIIDQVKTLKKHKIKPFLLSREINSIYSKYFVTSSATLSLRTPKNHLTAKEILKDSDVICDFCIKHNIDFIDCNPFWCILPAALASQKLNMPSSFTLHGVNSGDFIAKEYPTAQAIYNLALSYGFCQIFTVAEYLSDLYPQFLDTQIIRNGFNIFDLKQKPFKNTQKVAIASRLDEPKSKIVIDFLPKIYSCNAIKQIDIYGDGSHFDQVKEYIANNHFENKIHIQGWAENLSEKIYNSDYMIIFGMGRVVLDAIKSGTPAGVLGYGGFAGLVSRPLLSDFSKNNLTSWQESSTTLSYELNQLFKKPNNYLFKASDLSTFNNEVIWEKYYNIITKTEAINRPYINNIYNLLLSNPSINILNDNSLFLDCIRMLSDGNKPISPRLFYNIFQLQFDRIDELQRTHSKSNNKTFNKIFSKLIFNNQFKNK